MSSEKRTCDTMRFISKLSNTNTDLKNIFSKSNTSEIYFYDKTIYYKYMKLNKLYENNPYYKNNWRKIVCLLHPFELIKTEISTSLIPQTAKKPIKITNAFMKMYEFITYLDKTEHYLETLFNKTNTLTFYDIAGAPGMFVIAAHKYLENHYPKTTLDWHTSSLEGVKNAFVDTYNLYKSNPNRYASCDVTNLENLTLEINKFKGTKKLVTGDIGAFHDDNWNKLQEESQLHLEYGQMILALNLVAPGGCLFLKMYSLVTLETIRLLDILSSFFEKVYITKPYTSRILNDESYIACINRNSKDCSKLPLLYANVPENYISTNIDLVKSFENSRLDAKYYHLDFIERLLKKYFDNDDKSSSLWSIFEKCKSNKVYDNYFQEFSKLFNELNSLK